MSRISISIVRVPDPAVLSVSSSPQAASVSTATAKSAVVNLIGFLAIGVISLQGVGWGTA
jgi:hypothetical protein